MRAKSASSESKPRRGSARPCHPEADARGRVGTDHRQLPCRLLADFVAKVAGEIGMTLPWNAVAALSCRSLQLERRL